MIYLVVSFNKDNLISTVKNKIIDKAIIYIDFTSIDISFIKTFPKTSVILNNALFLYSSNKSGDTLVFAKQISFSFNLLKILQGKNEINKVELNNGKIFLDYGKLEKLFISKQVKNDNQSVFGALKRVNIKNCYFNYSYGTSFSFSAYLQNTTLTGLFYGHNFKLSLSINGENPSFFYETTDYKSEKKFSGSGLILGTTEGFKITNGNVHFGSLSNTFNLSYSYKTEDLLFDLFSKETQIKNVFNTLIDKDISDVAKGNLLYKLTYRGSFLNSEKQFLTIKYDINNLEISLIKHRFLVNKLTGLTAFSTSLSKNNTEISDLDINYNGFKITGNAKIKNLNNPLVLSNLKIKGNGKFSDFQKYSFSVSLNGVLKSLVQINDIKNINISTIKIKKVFTDIDFDKLVSGSMPDLQNLSGKIQVNDNELNIPITGVYNNSHFKCNFWVDNFLNILLDKRVFNPRVNLSIDSLNLDRLLSSNNDSFNINNYYINGQINQVILDSNIFKNLNFSLVNRNGITTINKFSINAFSGMISGTDCILDKETHKFSLKFSKVNIQEIFEGFRNFNQSFLIDKNVIGKLSGNVTFSYSMIKKGGVDPLSIILDSHFLIENGEISDLKQFKSLSTFLKINDLETIKFQNLENDISIRMGSIYIPSMEIKSNAFNIQISGVHAFSGNFTYWLKVSLSEILSKRFLENNYTFENSQNINGKGINLFLKLEGTPESYKIKYDKETALKQFKQKLILEGQQFKAIMKNEFVYSTKDSLPKNHNKLDNKFDSTNNKKKKSTFNIEWDEIDTLKQQ